MADDLFRAAAVVEPAGPPAMTEAAAVGAEGKDGKKMMLLFGGWVGDKGTCSGALWAYDPLAKTFDAVNTEGERPCARCAHVFAFSKGGAVLFGGEDSNHNLLSDTWYLALNEAGAWQWTLQAAEGPSARRGAAFTAVGDGRYVLHGGMDGERKGDLWMYDANAAAWTELTATGTLPAPRDGHALAYEAKRNAVHLFGGFDVSDSRDRFTLYLEGPASGDGAAAEGAGDAAGEAAAGPPSCDWVSEPATPSDPCPRNGHSVAVLGEPNNVLVVTLGFCAGAPHPECSEIQELPFADSSAWVTRKFAEPAGECLPLPPRRLHATAVIDGKVVLFGGWDGKKYLKNVVELDFVKVEGGAPGKKK